MKIFNFKFFKRIGFYLSILSIAALILAVLSYIGGFTGVLLEYNSTNVCAIALIGIVAFFVLLFIDFTSNVAPVVLWVATFLTLLVYISNIYMYFTGIFYNGVSVEAFRLIDPVVMISTGLFVASFVLSNIAMYTNHSATVEVRR